ncbi:hypothetical protein, partial [Mucilaginibacter sp. 10I4]|uniref:hypothetical protein n=1 Tax=Mucilaginibacter sp. 10I4 TaxID=3048580 RepID=UPI002B239C06
CSTMVQATVLFYAEAMVYSPYPLCTAARVGQRSVVGVSNYANSKSLPSKTTPVDNYFFFNAY